jgi:alkylhydroperoxidase family enzyme
MTPSLPTPTRLAPVSRQIDELRERADALEPPRPELHDYLEKVRVAASTITDDDIERLKQAGCSEDEIFEQTVGVAIREGLRRLDAAERAIG